MENLGMSDCRYSRCTTPPLAVERAANGTSSLSLKSTSESA